MVSIPIGVFQGFLEIALGMAFYQFLAAYGFTPSNARAAAAVNLLGGPVYALLTIAGVLTLFRMLQYALPRFTYEMFCARVRRMLANYVLRDIREASGVTVADLSHVLAVSLPVGGKILDATTVFGIASLQLITIFGSIVYLAPVLTVVTLVSASVLVVPILALRRSFFTYSERMRENASLFTRRFTRDVRNLYFLKLMGANDAEADDLLRYNDKILRNVFQFTWRFSSTAAAPPFMGILLIVVAVWINVRFEIVPLAIFVPFIYLLWRIASVVASLTAAIAQWNGSLPFFGELTTLIRTLFSDAQRSQEALGTKELPPVEKIVVDNLAVGRDRPLFGEIGFRLEMGEMLLISAPSGKGKTTLLMTLVGLIKRLGGRIEWNGLSIDAIDPSRLRRQVGYAGQEPFLFDGTIRENLLYGNDRPFISQAEIETALHVTRAGFIADFGLDHHLKEGGDGISAGQKQRLAIARSLLRRPRILLLDEATANIDEEVEAQIMESIRKEFAEMMIIAVSHRNSLRRFASLTLDL